MHYSARDDHLFLVQLLVDRGAFINIQSTTGFTPLYLAVHNYCIPTVEYLIGVGADVNVQTNDGYTALMIAVFDMATVLVNAGACALMTNNYGENVYDLCYDVEYYKLYQAVHDRDVENLLVLAEIWEVGTTQEGVMKARDPPPDDGKSRRRRSKLFQAMGEANLVNEIYQYARDTIPKRINI